MPFIRRTEQQLEAMPTERLIAYCQIVERLFANIRLRLRLTRFNGPVPQDWRDCVAEINAVQHLVVFRAMVDAHVDAMLPDAPEPEDPCVDPN